MRTVTKTGLAALAAALLAASAARAELRVLAPPDGAVVAVGKVPLIGVGAGAKIEVTHNGRKVAGIGQTGNAFTGVLVLAEGKNVLTFRAGDLLREVTVFFKPGAKEGVFTYHDPVAEGSCKECHPQGVGRTAAVEAKLCRSCHDPKDGAPYVHGPIGAGQCTICHDPHGSARKAFLVAGTRELCVSCHDQDRSKEHIERAKNRACPECHDPHGSGKKYLLY
jgi:predicted CXXCH cytochrome family protein